MSRMLPRRSIDVFRQQVDVSLGMYGIDCHLFIPTNTSYNEAEKLDVFAVANNYDYLEYSAKVFIEWSPNTYKLKKLGLFTEDSIPILVWFGNKAVAVGGSEAGEEVDIDIVLHSYFTIEPEYIPNNYKGTESFELVNFVVKHMHDAILVQGYLVVPRRIKNE
jgi:hypothetical protein